MAEASELLSDVAFAREVNYGKNSRIRTIASAERATRKAAEKERDEAVLAGWRAAHDCIATLAANSYPYGRSGPADVEAILRELRNGAPGDYLDIEWKSAQDAIAAEAEVERLREALTETLAIAERNEAGNYIARARSALSPIPVIEVKE
jgi:hypothetical protein